MKLIELSQAQVEKLDFACNNFLQSWEMYQRYQDLGRESYFLGLVDDGGEVQAAGLLVARPWHFGKKVFRVAGGWLMDYEHKNYSEILQNITQLAREFCREKQGIALEIAPNLLAQPRDAHNNIVQETEKLKSHLEVKNELIRLGYKYLGEYEQVKWTFVLDLDGQEPEELFKAFRTDHRQRIHRAEREGVCLRELKLEELGILKEIAAEAGERHGFRDPEMDYYKSMKKAFGDKVKFVVAELPAEKLDSEQQGEYVPLAAAMFVNDGREMIYLYSGSVRKLQKYGGAHYIQWQMIQEALKTGCEKYNFYGVYPVEGNGVYNFKLGFRGRVEELLGTFMLPIGVLGKIYVAKFKPREYGEVH